MSLFAELLLIPLQAVATLWVAMLIIRAWATATQAPMRQPAGEFIMRLTDFAVLPLRRAFKFQSRIDWACILLGYAACAVFVFLAGVLLVGRVTLASFWWVAFLTYLRWAIYTAMVVLIAQAVLSWTQTNPSASAFTHRLTEPLLGPLRRFIPMIGAVDLTPLVLILLLQMALVLIGALGRAF